MEVTRELLPLTEGMTVVIGTVDRDYDLYNAAAVLHDGQWMGTYRKRYLPNYGVFDENRYFMPGTRNPVFVRGGTVIGVNICEDIWYPGGPVEDQVIRGGAEIIVNLSASPYHAGKAQVRKRMLCTRAADNLAIVCYVNLVGGQDEIVYDGCSLVVDEQGRCWPRAGCSRKTCWSTDVTSNRCSAPGSTTRASARDARWIPARAHPASISDRRVHSVGPAVRRPTSRAASRPRSRRDRRSRAARFGLSRSGSGDLSGAGARDQRLREKNGFDTVVLGLSGGIDSSLCAASPSTRSGRVT
jgi:NAD+ synthase (glutamine-hydrolysing)